MADMDIRARLADLLYREAQGMTGGEFTAFKIELMRRLPVVVGEAAQAARGGVRNIIEDRVEAR